VPPLPHTFAEIFDGAVVRSSTPIRPNPDPRFAPVVRVSTGREIRLVEEHDGWLSAIDEATGVASQGETRE